MLAKVDLLERNISAPLVAHHYNKTKRVQNNSYLWYERAVLWLFFFGSREETALGRQLESHVTMTFMQQMNYKCQPVALYLEQVINMLTWLLLVEERSGFYGSNSP